MLDINVLIFFRFCNFKPNIFFIYELQNERGDKTDLTN